ncbi:MAG: phospho-N-acetylmuramoyl-pentapeptide-transferase [Anaerovoracaceae bacterium]
MMIIPALIAFALTVVLTRLLIPVLRRLAGQNIREEGPQAHQAKAGTPSMGGIAMLAAVVAAYVIGSLLLPDTAEPPLRFHRETPVLLGAFLLFGLIGYWDDHLKVIKKQNEGLKAWQKFGLQFVVAVLIAVYMGCFTADGTHVYLPFAGFDTDFGFWYYPFIIFTILAMVNAVNLTDGLDGLAAGTTAIVSLFLLWLACTLRAAAPALSTAVLLGACLGFLVWNHHPARVFMGDTGSLALGGLITAAAIVMKMELLLPIVGIIYVLEVLSVCLQVAWFKATHGRRLFRMTPLHHHFELSGMKETHVVVLFWSITAAACLAGVLAV